MERVGLRVGVTSLSVEAVEAPHIHIHKRRRGIPV